MLDNFYQGEGSLGGSVASKVFPKIPAVARSFKEAVRELRHCVCVGGDHFAQSGIPARARRTVNGHASARKHGCYM